MKQSHKPDTFCSTAETRPFLLLLLLFGSGSKAKAILRAKFNCFVCCSSILPGHKQFSCTQLTITEYKGHLKLKRWTTEWPIKTMLLCPTSAYRLQNSFTGIWQWCSVVAEHNVCRCLAHILQLCPLLLVTWALHCGWLHENQIPCLVFKLPWASLDETAMNTYCFYRQFSNVNKFQCRFFWERSRTCVNSQFRTVNFFSSHTAWVRG